MMGLGYRQSHKNLKHPKHLHSLRRADEELGDVVVLGAILTFGFGTFFWLFLEAAPPEVFEYYSERDEYLDFLYPLLNLFFFCTLFIWFLDTARAWPRFLIVAMAALHGSIFLFGGVLGGGGSWEVVANALAVCYSAAIAWVAIAQIFTIRESLDGRS